MTDLDDLEDSRRPLPELQSKANLAWEIPRRLPIVVGFVAAISLRFHLRFRAALIKMIHYPPRLIPCERLRRRIQTATVNLGPR